MFRILRKAMLVLASAAALTPVPAALAREALSIDDITWHYIESYCTFMRADHAFVFDDPDSWRFVFFTNFTSEAEPETFGTGFMRIDGALREFRMVSVEGDTVTMQTSDAEPVVATLALVPGEKGYEATGYTGTITVARGGASSSVDFKGDCGV